MKPVNVLFRIDAFEDRVLGDMLRKRQLDENTVYRIILVELADLGQQLPGCDGTRNGDLPAVDSKLLTRLRLHVDVGGRRGVVAHENDCQPRLNPSPLQALKFRGNLALDILGDLRPVDESSGHRRLISRAFGRGL